MAIPCIFKILYIGIRAPSDCDIRSLEDKDSSIINNLWAYGGTPETEAYVKLMIALNPSRGLYGKEENDLRSWILRCTSNNNNVFKIC